MLLVPVPRSRLMGDSGRRDLLWDFGLILLAPQLMSIPDPPAWPLCHGDPGSHPGDSGMPEARVDPFPLL